MKRNDELIQYTKLLININYSKIRKPILIKYQSVHSITYSPAIINDVLVIL